MPRRLRDVTPPRRRRSTQVNSFATDDLKKLFLFRPHTASDLHDELQCPVCTGKIAAKKDRSKRGGANVLSAKAAARCLEVLQASLLSDDADAKKRLLTPIPSSGDELHGPVDKKRWTASKPHADLGSVFAKLKPESPGLYGTIPDVLKDLRRIKRTTDKLWPDINEHPTRLAAQKLVQEVDALWEGLCDEMYAANAESKSSTTEACSILEPQEPGDGYKPQQYPLPKEEDLNNWSHHASLETCGDEVLKKALRGRDDVTFVFGMYQRGNQSSSALQFGVSRDVREVWLALRGRLYLSGIVSNLTHWFISTQACTRTGT